MTHHHTDKPSLEAITSEANHEYLSLDIASLIDAYGIEPFLTLLGRVLYERPFNFAYGADQRLVDAAVLLANAGEGCDNLTHSQPPAKRG